MQAANKITGDDKRMNLSMKNGKVTIDGRDFVGRDISINGDGEVIVDGVTQAGTLVGDISVVVHGDVESISNDRGDIKVSGSAGAVKTVSGDVECGDVSGSVQTVSGDVGCGVVHGSVKTVSGDVRKA